MSNKKAENGTPIPAATAEAALPGSTTVRHTCGIVMPISAIDGLAADHWKDVRAILAKAIGDAGFDTRLVSEADEVNVIQKTIVHNLYKNPIVVCDVSAKNPNVMFELGLRLCFDKPTVIVKDDKTTFSFDTGIIEHIEYPRDLRHTTILEFQKELTRKIQATHEAGKQDGHSQFLKHFHIEAPKLDRREVPEGEFILNRLDDLGRSVQQLSSLVTEFAASRPPRRPPAPEDVARNLARSVVRKLDPQGQVLVEKVLERLLQELPGSVLSEIGPAGIERVAQTAVSEFWESQSMRGFIQRNQDS